MLPVLLCPSQAIPGMGAHPHTLGHHRGLEHPTPSHQLLRINVSPAPCFATKLTLFSTMFLSDEETFCEQTGKNFIKTLFRIHKLCDEKQLKHGIELRTDSRFDSKSTHV